MAGRPRVSDSSLEDVARKREEHRRRQEEIAALEREKLRALHWMRCPKCGAEMTEIVFRGVKVDKCFGCGGVYLDDGELEQLAGKPGWLESMRYLFEGK